MTNEKIKYEIIDNVLPLDKFDKLQKILLPQGSPDQSLSVPWCYSSCIVANPNEKEMTHTLFKEKGISDTELADEDWRLFGLSHMVYAHKIISPNFFHEIISTVGKSLDIKALMRIKLNMYQNTETIKEHGMHIDYDFSHKAAIYSVNTCDGYTKLKDGTKIDSIANRLLLFDASLPHTSSTTANQTVRVNINFNYF